MQNLDVLFILALCGVASYYGIFKPTVEATMKDMKEGGSRQAGKEGSREVRVVIDNLSQTEITLYLRDEELSDESVVLARALEKLGGR